MLSKEIADTRIVRTDVQGVHVRLNSHLQILPHIRATEVPEAWEQDRERYPGLMADLDWSITNADTVVAHPALEVVRIFLRKFRHLQRSHMTLHFSYALDLWDLHLFGKRQGKDRPSAHYLVRNHDGMPANIADAEEYAEALCAIECARIRETLAPVTITEKSDFRSDITRILEVHQHIPDFGAHEQMEALYNLALHLPNKCHILLRELKLLGGTVKIRDMYSGHGGIKSLVVTTPGSSERRIYTFPPQGATQQGYQPTLRLPKNNDNT